MEYLIGFASAISRDLVCGAFDQLRYPCCFNNFVKDLQKEEGNLVVTKDSVQDRVAQAKKQTKKTAEVVDKWLKEANANIDNVSELLKQARTKKSFCLNWIWKYNLGKNLAKKKGDVKACIEEGRQYIQIERLASLPGYRFSKKCWEFDSRKSAYEELMNGLKDDEVNMIGLYGMGGCGKTMLAMEVRKRANHLFDQVLFVPVSSTVEVHSIQDKIASSLEFEFQEKDEIDRSQRLSMRLSQEDRILVILDDVWQMLDFDAIGIPCNEHHDGLKVLITTRCEAICTLMDCQKKILLSILTNDEAWTLFQNQALISEGTSNTLKHLAREISDQCKGLPVAIGAVASSLKGKPEVEWKVALDRLTSSKPVNIEKGLQNPYKCMQLSYDNLDSLEAKSLFLLCSVFPEDSEIPLEYLIRSAIGLGIVGEVRSYEGARNEVSAAKNKLISSCLLLEASDGKCVKMHDLVRDVAHWIAENEDKVIVCALEKDVTWEHCSIRYLWCDKIPNDLDCSNLEFLCIHAHSEALGEIFKGMTMLRVLFLYNKGWERRPLSTALLKSLTNLRCILLSKWELGDISFVGDITKLESLTLHDCSFHELPNNVAAQLANLRLLDLSECDMKRNPFEVIGRHPQLEELYFADRRSKLVFYNEHAAELFKKFRVPQALQRYHIQLGVKFAGFQQEFLNRHRTLFLSYLDTSNAAVRDLAQKAEVLCLAGIEGGAKNIIPDIFQTERGMDHLIELLIRDSEEIECLVDISKHLNEVGTLFSKLHWLRLESMNNLGALCRGWLPPCGHFEKLADLYLSHCPKLICLFTLAVAQNLVQLEKLKLLSCSGLKHIMAEDDREEISTDNHRMLFPKLKQLHVLECDKLEYIIPISFAKDLVQLECLEIVRNRELKYIFGQCTHVDQNQKVELTSLEELTLIMLPNIISICPEVCYPTWPSLRQFSLQNCPGFSIVSLNTCMALHNNQIINEASHLTVQNIKDVRVENCELEGIIQLVGLSIAGKQDPLTPNLEMMYLENLPQLRYICKGDMQSVNLHNLQQMELSGCRKLKSVFSACIAADLPQLKMLKIENCNQLQQIIEDDRRKEKGPFNLPSLTSLTIKSCPMLSSTGSLFTASTAKTLTSLEELMIQDCHGLKHILVYDRAPINKKEEIVQVLQDDHNLFPSLKRLSIIRCQLLQYIFPASFARGLVKLETVEIAETPELRYVFGQKFHSSHQFQNKIQIELPVLEKVALYSIPNMLGIFPENHEATCSSLQLLVMNDIGMSTLSINNLTVDSDADHSSETDTETASTMIKENLVSVVIENNSTIEGIFHVNGFPTIGQQVTSWLEDLKLINLPELRYVWTGAKHLESIQVQNLHKLHICNCPKLKAIFSASVLRILPLLKILVVEHCEELEQIIEDDEQNENDPSPQCPKECISLLKFIIVTHCNKMKCLISSSITHKFPELEYLILNQDSGLVQVFQGEPGWREGKVEVLLPKLKHVILTQLPNLIDICQGIELQTQPNILVHNCPRFSLTSTTTFEDMLQASDPDKDIDFYLRPHLHGVSGIITNGYEFLTSKKENKETQDLQSWEQKLSSTPLLNLTENIEETEPVIIGEVAASKKPAIPTSVSELSKPSLTSSAAPLHKLPWHCAEEALIDRIQEEAISEEAISEEAINATLFVDVEGASLSSAAVAATEARDENMLLQDSLVVAAYSESVSLQSDPLESEYRPYTNGNDLISLFQLVEEDGDVQVTTTSASEVAAEHFSTKDNLVAKVLADLEESLKIPLKDIASSEANSLRLLTALDFLSHLPLKDVTLSDELETIVNSMHKAFPSILCSFKQAFATTDKFAALEAHQNEVELSLVSKISRAKKFMDKAQQKEEILKETIIRLEKEIKECEADLSSLQEEKKKCFAETIGYKKEFENVKGDKSQMVEDQRKARQELFEVNHRWSALRSQFKHKRIAARNPS